MCKQANIIRNRFFTFRLYYFLYAICLICMFSCVYCAYNIDDFSVQSKKQTNSKSQIDDLELCVKLLKFNGGLHFSTVIQTYVCKTESVCAKVKTNIGRVLSLTVYTSGFYFKFIIWICFIHFNLVPLVINQYSVHQTLKLHVV